MTYIIIRLCVIAVGGYVIVCGVLWLFQAKILYYPYRTLEFTPRTIGLVYEDVRLTTADDIRIHGWFVPTEKEKGAVLFCHGNAGNISHRLYTLKLLQSFGLSTFMFDYRGYGESEGKPSEQGTYMDATAAWQYLVKDRQIPSEKIIIFGRSLGGCIAAQLASKQTPAMLILESSFTSVPDMAAEIYPFLPVRLLCRYRYAADEYIQEVNCPVLVIHSPKDEIAPYRLGRELYAAANEPKEFLEIDGTHNDGFMITGEKYTTELEAFINRMLLKIDN